MNRRPDDEKPLPAPTGEQGRPERGKRPYSPPQLDALGDVRDLTLAGTTPGVGDSSFANTRP
jgi:hypothetical protein